MKHSERCMSVLFGIREPSACDCGAERVEPLIHALRDLVEALDICGGTFIEEHPFTMDAARDAIAKEEVNRI